MDNEEKTNLENVEHKQHSESSRNSQELMAYYTIKKLILQINEHHKSQPFTLNSELVWDLNSSLVYLKNNNKTDLNSENLLKNNLYNRLPMLLLAMNSITKHTDYYQNKNAKSEDSAYLVSLKKLFEQSESRDMLQAIENTIEKIK
jgi:hypothetical protein